MISDRIYVTAGGLTTEFPDADSASAAQVELLKTCAEMTIVQVLVKFSDGDHWTTRSWREGDVVHSAMDAHTAHGQYVAGTLAAMLDTDCED